MGEPLKETITQLTDEQISFIVSELNVTSDFLLSATESELDHIYESLCDIECKEIDENYECSPRGNMAADIVTILGNAIAQDSGYWDEGDDVDAKSQPCFQG